MVVVTDGGIVVDAGGTDRVEAIAISKAGMNVIVGVGILERLQIEFHCQTHGIFLPKMAEVATWTGGPTEAMPAPTEVVRPHEGAGDRACTTLKAKNGVQFL